MKPWTYYNSTGVLSFTDIAGREQSVSLKGLIAVEEGAHTGLLSGIGGWRAIVDREVAREICTFWESSPAYVPRQVESEDDGWWESPHNLNRLAIDLGHPIAGLPSERFPIDAMRQAGPALWVASETIDRLAGLLVGLHVVLLDGRVAKVLEVNDGDGGLLLVDTEDDRYFEHGGIGSIDVPVAKLARLATAEEAAEFDRGVEEQVAAESEEDEG